MKMSRKNVIRRSAAAFALQAHQECIGSNGDDALDIQDLITGLLHLAEAKGVLPSGMDVLVGYAVRNYEHESNPAHADYEV